MHALASALIAVLMSGHAWAAGWTVDPVRSQVAFDYTRSGQAASGVFTRFQGTGQFDPTNIDGTRMELRIASKSHRSS